MLDWDKPLSEQSQHVQDALAGFGIKPRVTGDELHAELLSQGWKDDAATRAYADQQAYDLRGAHAYRELQNRAGSPANAGDMRNNADDQIAAANALRAAGIPGIKYLDAGSRGAGEGPTYYRFVFG